MAGLAFIKNTAKYFFVLKKGRQIKRESGPNYKGALQYSPRLIFGEIGPYSNEMRSDDKWADD